MPTPALLSLLAAAGGGAAWTPQSVSGLLAWWDASDTATITVGTGCSQIDDKSGNARHMTMATTAQQPLTGTRSQNSLNVLDFDGVNDYMTAGDTMDLLTGGVTMIGCAAWDTTAQQGLWGKGFLGNSAGRYALLRDGGLVTRGLFEDTANRLADWSDSSTAFRVYTMTITRSGGNVEIFVDGTSRGTAATSGATSYDTTDAWVMGAYTAGGLPMNGCVGELFVYNTPLGTADRQAAEAYLKAKWGTA